MSEEREPMLRFAQLHALYSTEKLQATAAA
jgi:hypothetical protein